MRPDVHNTRKRGIALQPALMELLVIEDSGIQYEHARIVCSSRHGTWAYTSLVQCRAGRCTVHDRLRALRSGACRTPTMCSGARHRRVETRERMAMASGDAQRVWFPEMIAMLRQAADPAMSVDAVLLLRDRLDATLQHLRRTRKIRGNDVVSALPGPSSCCASPGVGPCHALGVGPFCRCGPQRRPGPREALEQVQETASAGSVWPAGGRGLRSSCACVRSRTVTSTPTHATPVSSAASYSCHASGGCCPPALLVGQ